MKDVTTQKIVKGQFANQFNKRNARNEFQTIIDYTDKDQNHKDHLEKLDASICRYKDI